MFEEEIRIASSNCGQHRVEIKKADAKALTSIEEIVAYAETQPEGERLQHNEQLEFLGDAALEFLCRYDYYLSPPSNYVVLPFTIIFLVFTYIICFRVLNWGSCHPIDLSW